MHSPCLGQRAATKLLRRVQFHYTPKHASWLNMAEIEIGILSRQCLDRRIASRQLLRSEVDAWQQARNALQRTIEWKFTRQDADIKLGRHYVSKLACLCTSPTGGEPLGDCLIATRHGIAPDGVAQLAHQGRRLRASTGRRSLRQSGRDRVTMLPRALTPRLNAHIGSYASWLRLGNTDTRRQSGLVGSLMRASGRVAACPVLDRQDVRQLLLAERLGDEVDKGARLGGQQFLVGEVQRDRSDVAMPVR